MMGEMVWLKDQTRPVTVRYVGQIGEPDKLWRARFLLDEDDHPYLYVRAMRIVRRTPRGVWVDDYGTDRFVLNDARKRFAYPTENEAVVACMHRLASRIRRLETELDTATRIREAVNQSFRWSVS